MIANKLVNNPKIIIDGSIKDISQLPELLKDDILIVNTSGGSKCLYNVYLPESKINVELVVVKQISKDHYEVIIDYDRRSSIGKIVDFGNTKGMILDAYGSRIRLLRVSNLPQGKHIQCPHIEDDYYIQNPFMNEENSLVTPNSGHNIYSIKDQLNIYPLTLKQDITKWLPICPGTGEYAMPVEYYNIPKDTCEAILNTKGRVIAVGCSTVKAIETWATTNKSEGWSDLYIKPEETETVIGEVIHRFQKVDGILNTFNKIHSMSNQLLELFNNEELLKNRDISILNHLRRLDYGDSQIIWRNKNGTN